MVGCSLRQGILLKGYYLIFLKRTESDQFRLARDRLTATLDLREGDYAGLRPRGASAETRVLSILFDQARRQSDDSQARELLQKAFNLIHQWKLESENLGFWEEWTGHGNTRNTEFACDSNFAVYWWAVDACAETVRGRDSESLRRNQMSWDQQQQDWKRDPSAWRARTMAGQNTLNRVP